MVRNLGAWDKSPEDMPVFPTTASQFNDEGVNRLFAFIIQKMNEELGTSFVLERYQDSVPSETGSRTAILPGKRQRYLSETSETIEKYHTWADEQTEIASRLDEVSGTLNQLTNRKSQEGT